MKSFIFSLILFALIIAAVIINSLFVNGFCQRLAELSEEIVASKDGRLERIDEMKSLLKARHTLLDLSIKAVEIEKINSLIEALYACYYSNNEPELRKTCALMIELTGEISRYESVSVKSLC